MTVERTKPIGIGDLPADIELDLPEKPIGIGGIIRALGLLVIAVGVLTLIFGPETVSYNPNVGMSFSQFICAFPGPITTVGFILAGIGQTIESNSSTSHELAIKDALMYKVIIPERRIPTGFRVQVDHLSGNHFRVHLVEKTGETEQETSPAELGGK